MTRTMFWSLPAAAILAMAAGGAAPADAAKMKSKQPTARCDCSNCSAPHCPKPGGAGKSGDRYFFVDESGVIRGRKKPQLRAK
jgi:hypothetical protein